MPSNAFSIKNVNHNNLGISFTIVILISSNAFRIFLQHTILNKYQQMVRSKYMILNKSLCGRLFSKWVLNSCYALLFHFERTNHLCFLYFVIFLFPFENSSHCHSLKTWVFWRSLHYWGAIIAQRRHEQDVFSLDYIALCFFFK